MSGKVKELAYLWDDRWPSMSGSIATDSANHGSKKLRKKKLHE
jgi:hypothetical protein